MGFAVPLGAGIHRGHPKQAAERTLDREWGDSGSLARALLCGFRHTPFPF